MMPPNPKIPRGAAAPKTANDVDRLLRAGHTSRVPVTFRDIEEEVRTRRRRLQSLLNPVFRLSRSGSELVASGRLVAHSGRDYGPRAG